MLCTAPSLRTAAIGCRIQPSLLTPCTFHTSSSTSSARSTDPPPPTQRRVPLAKRHVSFNRPFKPAAISSRAVSTVAEPQTSQPSAASTTTTQYTNPEILDWNSFFKLRRTRRFYQLGSSIGMGINGFVSGAAVLSHSDMDAIVSQIPLDPFITLGLITFTCGGTGWLLGPILGTGVFNWKIGRTKKQQMGEKEVEFYRRIKRYRVDPSGGSASNPVPDYYGEKIASVKGYRQWLKDQRAFNKKRHTYV